MRTGLHLAGQAGHRLWWPDLCLDWFKHLRAIHLTSEPLFLHFYIEDNIIDSAHRLWS